VKKKRLTRLLFVLIGVMSLLSAADNETLYLRSADRNSNSMVNGSLVSTLEGNVIFDYADYSIRSDWAQWWRAEEVIKLRGNIKVTHKRQKLSCDVLNADFARQNIMALGNIEFIDSTEKMTIVGNRGEYDLEAKSFVLRTNPVFTRIDSVSNDTLSITGRTMQYLDSLKIMKVIQDVQITKGALKATSEKADYHSEQGFAKMRVNPRITFQGQQLVGDSIDLFFTQDTLTGIAVVGNGHGFYQQESQTDTSITKIWADSIYMSVNDSGKLDSVWGHQNVKTRYFAVSEKEKVNEATGKNMILSFSEGAVNAAQLWGNAQSLYYIDEADGSGLNEASGDTIAVTFSQGKAAQLSMMGKVRGSYRPIQIRPDKPAPKPPGMPGQAETRGL